MPKPRHNIDKKLRRPEKLIIDSKYTIYRLKKSRITSEIQYNIENPAKTASKVD